MGTRHCAPTKQWGHGHPVWGNDTLAVWTQGEPQPLPQLVKAWDHFMYQQSCGLPRFASTGQPSTTAHQDVSLLLPHSLQTRAAAHLPVRGAPWMMTTIPRARPSAEISMPKWRAMAL